MSETLEAADKGEEMTARQTLYVQAMHGFIVVASIAAVTVLGAKGTLDGQSVVAVLGAAIGFAGASAAGVGAIGQAVNGKAVIPNAALADREATLRQAVTYAQQPAAPSTVVVETPPEPLVG